MRGPVPVGRLLFCGGILTLFAGSATKSLPAAPQRPVRPTFAAQDGPSSIPIIPVTDANDRHWRRRYGRTEERDAESPDDAEASPSFAGGPRRGYFRSRPRFDRRRNFYRPRYYGRRFYRPRFYRPRYYRRPALPAPYYGPGYGGGFSGPGNLPPAPYGVSPGYGGFGLGFYGPGYSGWYGSGW